MELEQQLRFATREMLGIRLWSGSLGQLVEHSLRAVDSWKSQGGRPFVFACANPHSLTVADRDAEFKIALRAANVVVADGVGLTLVARNLYGERNLPRITGSEYFGAVMRELDHRGGRVAFFGSRPEVLQKIVARCALDFPRVKIVATISPPYGEWSAALNEEYLEQIRVAKADVLWVGMTAPKQEKWVDAHAGHIGAGLVGSIGAVFEYFAGTVKRAPEWLCRSGLEWAYRFAHEPARLWERNFISAPQFLNLALRDRAALRRSDIARLRS